MTAWSAPGELTLVCRWMPPRQPHPVHPHTATPKHLTVLPDQCGMQEFGGGSAGTHWLAPAAIGPQGALWPNLPEGFFAPRPAVPEPSAAALAMLGFLLLIPLSRRLRK